MSVPGPVLFPFDGSSVAAAALPFAVRVARGADAPLALIQAVEREIERADAECSLETLARSLREDGLGIETHVRVGPPGPVLVDAAARWHASLVVMSTHGRSGLDRVLHGSVAEYVVRHSPVPVMLVPRDCTCKWPASGERRACILVPLDGSPFSEAAVHPAVALARALRGDILLARVVDPTTLYRWSGFVAVTPSLAGATVTEIQAEDARGYLAAIAGTANTPDVNVNTAVRSGDPVAELTLLAGAFSVDAIVAATHVRVGLGRLVMGSVAAGLLRRAGVPALLVRPHAHGGERPAGSEAQTVLSGSRSP